MARKSIEPPKKNDYAVELIRNKISDLYASEPNARRELYKAQETGYHSKHQQYMLHLQGSGKSMSEIQTAWHNYYVGLPDNEKHQVWQEFYSAHSNKTTTTSTEHITEQDKPIIPKTNFFQYEQKPKSTHELQLNVQQTARRRANKKVSHLKSLGFGLSLGLSVVLIMLFGFFNERFIAPFITPSKNIGTSSIIIDPNNSAVSSEPLIIIPKINVEIPVVYDETSIEEQAVQKALERGVLHYATTPNPGEQGNGVIFGHSSNNILNNGKYKFAFVLLKRLENGDTFYVQKNGIRYAYKIFDKKVVDPKDISVLGNTQKTSTFTLITCDPPGTSLKRLVVVGEQISPDPNKNIASKNTNTTDLKPAQLPSNSPSLWSRITNLF